MKTRSLTVRCSCAAALAAIAMSVMAEVPPRGILPVRITPQIIQAAAIATTPTTAQVTNDERHLLGKEFQPYVIFRHSPQNLDQLPNGCGQKGGSLCFDYRSGQAVYKPMRQLLPGIPGMTPHNLSIRRGKVVAQYTFK